MTPPDDTMMQNLIERARYARVQMGRFYRRIRERSRMQGGCLSIPGGYNLPTAMVIWGKNVSDTSNLYRPTEITEETLRYFRESLANKIRLYHEYVDVNESAAKIASKYISSTALTADDAGLIHGFIEEGTPHEDQIREELNYNTAMHREAYDILHELGYSMHASDHLYGNATGVIDKYIVPAGNLPTLAHWPPSFNTVKAVEVYAMSSQTSMSVLMQGAALVNLSRNKVLINRYIRNHRATDNEFVDAFQQAHGSIELRSTGATQRNFNMQTYNRIHAMITTNVERLSWLPIEAPDDWWAQWGDDDHIAMYRAFSADCNYDLVAPILSTYDLMSMYSRLHRHRCSLIADAIATDWRDRAFIPGGREYHLALMHLAD